MSSMHVLDLEGFSLSPFNPGDWNVDGLNRMFSQGHADGGDLSTLMKAGVYKVDSTKLVIQSGVVILIGPNVSFVDSTTGLNIPALDAVTISVSALNTGVTPPVPTPSFIFNDVTKATANKLSLQAMIDALVVVGGGVITLPATAGGVIYMDSLVIPKYTTNGLLIQGQGMGITVIQMIESSGNPLFRRSGIAIPADDPNYALGGRLIFRNFTVRGTWQATHSQAANERPFNCNGWDYVEYDHIECTDSRTMSITSQSCAEAVVTYCRVQRSARDCINLTDCFNTKVLHNTCIDGWDDAIAVHTNNNPATDLQSQYHVCAHNLVENCNGISYDGMTKGTIHDNILSRVQVYGVQVRAFLANQVGFNDATDIDIHDNIITDVILKTKFTGGTSTFQTGILVSSNNQNYVTPIIGGAAPNIRRPNLVNYRSNNLRIMAATSNGTAVLTGIADTSRLFKGTPVSGTGITTGTYIVSVDSSSQVTLSQIATDTSSSNRNFGGNSGLNGIRVHDNVIRQSLPATSLYSDWGFINKDGGVGAWTDTGYQNPAMTTNHELSGNGIGMDMAILNLTISNNIIEGFFNPIAAQATLGSLYELHVTGNSLRRFLGSAVKLSVAGTHSANGRVFIEGNDIDGDPWFETANRTRASGIPDGTWNSATTTPSFIDVSNTSSPTTTGYLGFWTNRNNSFRNINQILIPLNALPDSWTGNVFFLETDGPRGIRVNGSRSITDRFLTEDSDPRSATYGQHLEISYGETTGFLGVGRAPTRWYTAEGAGPVIPNGIPLSNKIFACPIVIQSMNQWDQMGIHVYTAEAGAVGQCGIYESFHGVPNSLVKDFGSLDLSTTGMLTTTTLTHPFILAAGYYWLAILFGNIEFLLTVTSHTTAVLDGISSTVGLLAGMPAVGSGIPGGATILTVDSATQVTLTAPTTSSITTPVTFGGTCRVGGHVIDRQLRQRLMGGATDSVSAGAGLTGTFTWNPGNLVAGTGFEDHTGISVPGAVVGDRPFVLPPYDTQGVLLFPRVTAADTMAVSAFNPTAGAIDLANSTSWMIGVDKADLGDYLIFGTHTYGAMPAQFPTVSRVAAQTEHRVMIRSTV